MLAKKLNDHAVLQKPVEVEKPKKKEMWAYALGSFGIFSVWTLIGAFLTFYYTDVAGLAAGAVGTLMLIARLFDGVTDLGMGSVVDRTKSKHGKARPWLLWMSLPLAITTVLLFSVPDISSNGKVVYAYITYILFILLYTAVSIPYKTLLGVMTQHQHSRSLSNIYSAIFIMVGTMIVMTLTQPLAASLGWTTLAALYGFVTVLCLLITFRSVKERAVSASTHQEERLGVKKSLKSLFSNKYWIIVTAFCVTFYATIGLTQGAGLYYAAWILGDINLFPVIGLALSGPMIIGLFFIGPLVAKIGKRNVAMLGAAVFIVGQIVKGIDPTNLTTFLIGTVIAGLGAMPAIALVFAMINDTIEYGEYKTGLRTEGLVNSGASFGIKIGTGIGLALIGWLLGIGGYLGGAAEQPALAIHMILALNIYIPLALAVVQIILLLMFKIDKEYPTILAELQRRKSVN
ncbi:MFS transporter [Alkalihalobacterium chitinilyticum]|uniref:Glycoside-pentoside-hexuronide (GPH):cation symporter n=1 Tax=Alkalihalobacterium chitinilyticum TaxID=2980103 RepID=A0ABT5VGS9_9BACI|nr:glycoside-pentoside-hexuronide (GPH):cation symporter [Alkalihalobacterium chitinilyticum]MDE5414480.1 glycoside-pentoside-hexuronide (GPH):cation symporter [Alkalihalobacterium chitinilyticum]